MAVATGYSPELLSVHQRDMIMITQQQPGAVMDLRCDPAHNTSSHFLAQTRPGGPLTSCGLMAGAAAAATCHAPGNAAQHTSDDGPASDHSSKTEQHQSHVAEHSDDGDDVAPIGADYPVAYSRAVSCNTYLKRLHITNRMADVLLPQHPDVAPGVVKASSQAYTQLFKEHITLIDPQGDSWQVGAKCTCSLMSVMCAGRKWDGQMMSAWHDALNDGCSAWLIRCFCMHGT
jgi:hypothetical protein